MMRGGGAVKVQESFVARGIILKEKAVIIDQVREADQEIRAADLREIIELEHEEFNNMLEINSVSKQDLFFKKLHAGLLKNTVVDGRDKDIERDIQTDDIITENKQNQWPEDVNHNYAKN